MNTSFTRLITTTLQSHGTEIFDAVSTNNALFYMLNKRGNIRLSPGGRKFTHPIYHLQNATFKSYGKLDPIGTGQQEDITRAEYDVKNVAGSLVLSTMEEAMNAGSKEGLIKMAREVKEGAEISMTEVMGDQAWSAGTDPLDMQGIRYNIANTAAARLLGTRGGINRANYAYWRNYVGTADGDFSGTGLASWNTVLNETTFGKQGPTAIFTTKTIYGWYESTLTANIRYYQTELADAGFRHLAFSTLPVLFDDNCPTNGCYFMDLNSFWLQLLARGNFKTTPFQTAINQLSRVALMYVFGNITIGSMRTQGFISCTAL